MNKDINVKYVVAQDEEKKYLEERVEKFFRHVSVNINKEITILIWKEADNNIEGFE